MLNPEGQSPVPVETPAAQPAAAPAAVDAPPPAAAPDPELAAFKKLRAERDAAEAKAKAAEVTPELKTRADRMASIEAHLTAGDHLKAVRELGIDTEKLIEAFFAEEPAARAADAKVESVAKQLADLTKKIEDEKAAGEKTRAEQEAAEKAKQEAEQSAAAKTKALELVAAELKAAEAKYPRCARTPEAAEDALEVARIAAEKMGDLSKLTAADEKKIIAAAFDQLEAHYKAIGERYYLPPAPTERRGLTVVKATPKPSVDGARGAAAPATPPARPMTVKDATREAIEAARKLRQQSA